MRSAAAKPGSTGNSYRTTTKLVFGFAVCLAGLLQPVVLASPLAGVAAADWGLPRTVPAKCAGAASMDPALRGCAKYRFVKEVVPAIPEAITDLRYTDYLPGKSFICQGGDNPDKAFPNISACFIGRTVRSAKRRVAIVGDSHSAHWRPALDRLGKQWGWSVVSLYKSACDYTSLSRYGGSDPEVCASWRSDMPQWFARRPKIDTVVFSSVSKGDVRNEVVGYKKAWERLPKTVTQIVVIRDNPLPDINRYHGCVEGAVKQGERPGPSCAVPRSPLNPEPDAAVIAANELRLSQGQARRYFTVDLSDFFCDSKLCYPVIGGLLVFGDGAHQAPRFNRSLTPYLAQALASYRDFEK